MLKDKLAVAKNVLTTSSQLFVEVIKHNPEVVVIPTTFQIAVSVFKMKNIPALLAAFGAGMISKMTADQVHAYLLKKEEEAKALSEEFVASEE